MSGNEAIELLKGMGLNGKDAAALLNVHPNTITRWSRGDRPVGASVRLLQVLKRYGRPMVMIIREAQDE